MKNSRGFTLLEIIAAFVVLLIGFLGLLALFPVGLEAQGRANNVMMGTFVAQAEIEKAKSLGFDSVTDISKTQSAVPYDKFDYSVTVTEVSSNLKEVEVKAYWPTGEAEAIQRSVSLKTFLSDW